MGSGGGSKWNGNTQIDTKSTLTPAQQMLSSGLIGFSASDLFGTNGSNGSLANPNVYQGQRVAPFTGLQTDTLNMSRQQGLGSIGDMLSGNWMNPITSQAQNLWSTSIMPSIMNRQAGMDAANTGGTTQALMKGGQDLSTQLAGQLAPLQLQASSQGISGLNTIYGMGTQQQGIEQAKLLAAQDKWKEGQAVNNPMLAYALKLLPASGQQTENVVYQNPATSQDLLSRVFDIF